MSATHEPAELIGRVNQYFSHLAVAAVQLEAPLAICDRIHIKGHTTDLVPRWITPGSIASDPATTSRCTRRCAHLVPFGASTRQPAAT